MVITSNNLTSGLLLLFFEINYLWWLNLSISVSPTLESVVGPTKGYIQFMVSGPTYFFVRWPNYVSPVAVFPVGPMLACRGIIPSLGQRQIMPPVSQSCIHRPKWRWTNYQRPCVICELVANTCNSRMSSNIIIFKLHNLYPVAQTSKHICM